MNAHRDYPEAMNKSERLQLYVVAAIMLALLAIITTGLVLLVQGSDVESPEQREERLHAERCQNLAATAARQEDPAEQAFYVDQFHNIGCE
jgi:hypothetical protein